MLDKIMFLKRSNSVGFYTKDLVPKKWFLLKNK